MKVINRAFKYRLYPNQTQESKMSQSFGCCRVVYNNMVADFNNVDIKDTKIKSIPELKVDFPFLSDVSCAMLQQKQRDFIDFKKDYFRDLKNGRIESMKKSYIKTRLSKGLEIDNGKLFSIGKPNFKKKGINDSFRLPFPKFKINDKKIQLEKIGKVSYVQDRKIPNDSKLLSVTVSKNSVNQYFASVLVQCCVEELPKTNKVVGCDLGLKSFLTTSDNEVISNPRYFRKSQTKLKSAQRHLSRKVKKSNRYNKQKLKVAKIHKKVANQRSHFIHNVTTNLVRNYDEIVIEDLSVKNMVKNHKLAKSISDASFGMFRTQLTYKCDWYGKKLTIVDKWFPSSKTCVNCGNVKKDLTLSDRIYKCNVCSNEIDRDFQASLNLKNKAVGVNAA